MKYTQLPNTDLNVSKICLGTMTFGNQNSQADAHQQLDYALSRGVNFIDTAEMYAVPASKDTQGLTEQYIGDWLSKRSDRDQIVLATKIAGPNRAFRYIREDLSFSKASLDHALDHSLRRLQTDYIDLYQLHWPERHVNIFGSREYPYGHNAQMEDNFSAVLDRLSDYIKEGKIRYAAVSNETPFGLMKYMEAHRGGKLKVVSTQNAYSLLQRRDEIALTEVLELENIGYLAYSPLAFGVLSGKYLGGAKPGGARVTRFPNYSRYSSQRSLQVTELYNEIAIKHGLSLTSMALAWVNSRPFVTANIIGATSMEQLQENIGSIDVQLSDEVLKDIAEVHAQFPNPAP